MSHLCKLILFSIIFIATRTAEISCFKQCVKSINQYFAGRLFIVSIYYTCRTIREQTVLPASRGCWNFGHGSLFITCLFLNNTPYSFYFFHTVILIRDWNKNIRHFFCLIRSSSLVLPDSKKIISKNFLLFVIY